MSGGLAALLDDIAALAKLAAASIDDVGLAAGKASAKALGVVVDDTAVTPRYVEGLLAKRELPIIKKIAIGSLRNKILLILPVALLLSQFAPWAMTPLLMVGGAYLCFEGAEKVFEALGGGHHQAGHDEPAEGSGPAVGTPEHEAKVVSGAVRTDFILSAEIMAISLAEVASEPFLSRTIILIVVAIAITILVYGVVALIVKMDDVGLHLAKRQSPRAQRFGRALVKAMPHVMRVLSTVGIAAMLWVGGHIILSGVNTLGWHAPYDLLHHAEEAVHHVPGIGALLAWLVDTVASAIVGLIVGFVIVGIMHLIPQRATGSAKSHSEDADDVSYRDQRPTDPGTGAGGADDAKGQSGEPKRTSRET